MFGEFFDVLAVPSFKDFRVSESKLLEDPLDLVLEMLVPAATELDEDPDRAATLRKC